MYATVDSIRESKKARGNVNQPNTSNGGNSSPDVAASSGEPVLMQQMRGLTDTVDQLSQKLDDFIETQSELASVRSHVLSTTGSTLPRAGPAIQYLPNDPTYSTTASITSSRRLIDGRTPVPSISGLRMPTQNQSDFTRDENGERGNWDGHTEFILSCMGYVVGLGNIWRFPNKCYEHGGGAFLIAYLTMVFFVGMPMFFMELSLGQFCSNGPLTCWQFSPMFQGIGWAMVILSAFVCIYYNVVVAWSLYYLGASFSALPGLPWDSCDNAWNNHFCSLRLPDVNCTGDDLSQEVNGTCYNISQPSSPALYGLWNVSLADEAGITRHSASEQYYISEILEASSNIEDIGGVRWQLIVSLLCAWGIVFLCLIRGIKSSGKVVYFTAIFPYVVLIILFIYGLTLPGYKDGIDFYITPDWKKLSEGKVWADAAGQVMMSLFVSFGGLITLSSYNGFHNNCLRDTIIVTVGNSCTSIFAGFVVFSFLGFLAHTLGTTVDKVVEDGTSLLFVAVPAAMSHLPASPAWAVLFFFMLVTIGIDTQFTLVETIITSIVDCWESTMRKKRILVTLVTCVICCAIGIVMCTNGGIHILKLLDSYVGGWAALVIALTECLALMGVYGWRRFSHDIGIMHGSKPWLCWRVLWTVLTPCGIAYIMFYTWATYTPVSSRGIPFPLYVNIIGWLLFAFVLLPIPIAALVMLCRASGSCMQRVRSIAQPSRVWGPALPQHRSLVTYVRGPFCVDLSMDYPKYDSISTIAAYYDRGHQSSRRPSEVHSRH